MENKDKRFIFDATWFLVEKEVKEILYEFGSENDLQKITKFEIVTVNKKPLLELNRAYENFTLFNPDLFGSKIYRSNDTFYINCHNNTHTTEDFINYEYKVGLIDFSDYHRVISKSVKINNHGDTKIKDKFLYGKLYKALGEYTGDSSNVISLMAEGEDIIIRQILDYYKGQCWYLINFGDLYQIVIKHKK